jgi:transposase-like protein
VTYDATSAESGAPPELCPWCGQQRIHGLYPSPDGNRHYRCGACGTSFFIHELPQRSNPDRVVAKLVRPVPEKSFEN